MAFIPKCQKVENLKRNMENHTFFSNTKRANDLDHFCVWEENGCFEKNA